MKTESAQPSIKRKRTRAGTWGTFCKRYEPVEVEEGSCLREWDDPVFDAVTEKHVWTVVDCGSRMYVVPGYATANYMGRILTMKPWPDDEFSRPGYVY